MDIEIEQENENNNNNETSDKIKDLFDSIKNFEQLKNEVYEMKKYYENLSQITIKNFEEKSKNNELNFNQKLTELNKKFSLLIGDINPNDLEEKNENEIEGYKPMNLSEINTRLRAFQYSKANMIDLTSMNDEFDLRIKGLNRKLDELKVSIFGGRISDDENKSSENEEQNNDNSNSNCNSKEKILKMPRLNFASKTEFDKFKTESEEEFEKIWKEINNLKLNIDTFNDKIKNKANLDDLEELKNIILEKTEELFLNQNKRYVNYSSSLKILQENFKKLLKLLADKDMYEKNQIPIENNPIGGHSCASCETYLGDLKVEPKYVSWNRFPKKERDNGEIFKKVQNGYSRLLQMINFDNNGNPVLNPYTNSFNNETNISSNFEDNNTNGSKDKNDANQSFSNKRLFSSKVKKFSKETHKTIELMNSKKNELIKNKKLPSIRTSKSIDNFQNLKNSSNPVSSNKNNIYFINSSISQIGNETDKKNE